jgi:hypothetical protein
VPFPQSLRKSSGLLVQSSAAAFPRNPSTALILRKNHVSLLYKFMIFFWAAILAAL